MIFQALACDYDGTLASEDRIEAETISGLERARATGLRLILVTGRTFFELIRVCERLDLFDAVVAENGGVLYFPAEGTIRELAPTPSPRLLAELDRRGVPFVVGRVIVGTSRTAEARVREALAAAGVHLELVYNRAALMLLPAGISKGAAVRLVLRELGVSFQDMLALGDAENDLDLFEACEWTGCPENAVEALKERADWVFPGHDGQAIARAMDEILGGRLPIPDRPRHRIELGWTVETAEPVTLPARGINVLIQGDPLSGKSWLAGGLVEHLLRRRYAVLVIDPEGDFQVLGRLPGISWTGIGGEGTWGEVFGHFDHDPEACVVADLSALSHGEKLRAIEEGLGLVRQLRRRRGVPHWVILDEAHYSLHPEGVDERVVGLEDKGLCLVTYRAGWLRGSVGRAMDAFVLARTTHPEELALLRSSLGTSEAAVAAALPRLPQGEFVLIPPGRIGRRSTFTFVATPRRTPHVRHLKKYAEVPLPPERAFVFRGRDGGVVARAGNLGEFRHAVGTVDAEVLEHHASRGDFSRWVLGVFAEQALGAQLRKVEARWSRGEIPDLRQAVEDLIASWFGVRA